jgi:hypothetical protein
MSQHASEQTEEIEASTTAVRAAWERPSVVVSEASETQVALGEGSDLDSFSNS